MSDWEEDDAPEGVPVGYAWSFEDQEKRLPEAEYRAHAAILDDMEEEDLDALDLSRAGDYVLWAAAQAFDEIERPDDAVALLRRIAASEGRHPALRYPDILLRLVERLKDRGDYDEALRLLDRVEREDPELRDACTEERASVLVLSGRVEEGDRLFERTARDAPDDPWVNLIAAWAHLQRGRYEEALAWVEGGERALERVEDDEEAGRARSEIGRLRREAANRIDRRRRFGGDEGPVGEARPAGAPAAGLEDLRQEILAAIDAEEVRLVDGPPRDDLARARARERLCGLHRRASRAWGDAVEAADDGMIAAYDDLRWEIAGLAERFGVDLPADEGD